LFFGRIDPILPKQRVAGSSPVSRSSFTFTFTYDSLDRLTGASGGYSTSYSSANGRILTKSEDQSLTLSYDDASHVHAVTTATSEAGSFQMAYDANGNMVAENDDTFGYNGDNQLVSRTEGDSTITYVYDGQGNLVKKSSSDGTATTYVGGIYELRQDGSYVTYYGGFGRPIVMRLHESGGDPGSLHFLLADQLGSTSSVIDGSGIVEESAKYYPFGGLRSGDIELTDKGFTGQQDEGGDLGLYDYGARFYSSVIARFVSADPLGSQGDSQTIDRYSYAHNNPLRYTDPTGLCSPIYGGDCTADDWAAWSLMHALVNFGWGQASIANFMNYLSDLSKGGTLATPTPTPTPADHNAFLSFVENAAKTVGGAGADLLDVLGKAVDGGYLTFPEIIERLECIGGGVAVIAFSWGFVTVSATASGIMIAGTGGTVGWVGAGFLMAGAVPVAGGGTFAGVMMIWTGVQPWGSTPTPTPAQDGEDYLGVGGWA
jgi:RHS repeat-associated protein